MRQICSHSHTGHWLFLVRIYNERYRDTTFKTYFWSGIIGTITSGFLILSIGPKYLFTLIALTDHYFRIHTIDEG
jgi:hypothetical protein